MPPIIPAVPVAKVVAIFSTTLKFSPEALSCNSTVFILLAVELSLSTKGLKYFKEESRSFCC